MAASFCGYLALNMYLEFRGPETVDILPVFSKGRMVVLEVSLPVLRAREPALGLETECWLWKGKPFTVGATGSGCAATSKWVVPDSGKSNAETRDFRS